MMYKTHYQIATQRIIKRERKKTRGESMEKEGSRERGGKGREKREKTKILVTRG